jgi:cytochrome P450
VTILVSISTSKNLEQQLFFLGQDTLSHTTLLSTLYISCFVMLFLFAQIVTGLTLSYFVWSIICLEINYRRASSMGIPLVRLPIDPINTLWIIFQKSIWMLLDLLSINWGTFGFYSRRGWQFIDKADSHLRYGPIWALVTPADIHVSVADPGAIHDVLTRRSDFVRPSKLYSKSIQQQTLEQFSSDDCTEMLEIYGPCISTASLSDWPRHRKVLATPFNESIMNFVWDESLAQAQDMLHSWTHGPQTNISFSKDTRTLSLDVLAATGFRRSYPFRSSREPSTTESKTYRDALATVLDNALLLMLVPYKLLSFSLLPERWRSIGKAGAAFKQYMATMLDEETTRFKQGEKGAGSLMTAFVRALNTNEKSTGEGTQKGLTVQEIFGNICVINFAGHDSTANTLAFCMVLLSARPEVQDWVGEELHEVIGDTEDWKHEALFPRLKRCRAILVSNSFLRYWCSISDDALIA